MGNAVHEIRAHVLEMLAAAKRLCAFLDAHEELSSPGEHAAFLIARTRATVATHVADLREHLHRLGGTDGERKAAAAPLVPAAKLMREVYSRLGVVYAASLMLETNARALGFSSTAALAARHREEAATLLAQIREFMPQAA